MTSRTGGFTLRRGLLAAFAFALGVTSLLARVGLWMLTLRWLWRLRDSPVRRSQRWPLWQPVVAFAGATYVSAFVSGEVISSLAVASAIFVAITLYVIADAVEDADEADRLVSGIAVAAGFAALVGLIQYSTCPPQEPTARLARWFFHRCDRARAFYSIYMTLAGVLTMALLVTLPRVLPGGFRPWSAVVWLVTMAGLAMTYTRGAWLAVAAGAATLFLMVSRRARITLLVCLVLLALVFVLGPRDLSHRFRSMTDPEEAGIKERIYMWRSGVAMWRERPLLGWGPGGVKREYSNYALPEAYKKHTGHVHNTALQVLVERGVLGFAAWCWLWIAFYWGSIRIYRELGPSRTRERALVAGSIAAVTGYLVAGLSEHNLGSSVIVMMVFTIMALPWTLARR